MPRPLFIQDVIQNLQGSVANSLNSQVSSPAGPNAAFAYGWETSPPVPTDSVTPTTTAPVTVDTTAAVNLPSSAQSTYAMPLTLAASGEMIVVAWTQQAATTVYTPTISDNFTTPYTWTVVGSVNTLYTSTLYIGIYLWVGTGGAGTSGTVTVSTSTAQQACAVAAAYKNATGYGGALTASAPYNTAGNLIISGTNEAAPTQACIQIVRPVANASNPNVGWPYVETVTATQSGNANTIMATAPGAGSGNPVILEMYGNPAGEAWCTIGTVLT